jgi:GTPase SAR1 family protein
MRSENILRNIKQLHGIRRTLYITGAPGGGKTSICRQAASELNAPYIERHLPTSLVEDFGVPDMMTTDKTFGYKMPDWFPVKGAVPDGGILVFDDAAQGNDDLQKVIANIVQARNLHGVEMADWQVILTGNRQQDRAGANRILGHLSNRMTKLDYEVHLDDFTGYAISANVKPEVISFIRFRPGLLHDYDPNRELNPTPRAWVEGVSDVLGVVDPDLEYDNFMGAVGEGAAAEFVGFLKIFRKLPNPDAVLLHPTTADVPSDPATLYALSGALSSRATVANFDRVTAYVERMPKEFSVLAVSMAVRRDAQLSNTAAFTQWAVKHQDVLF